MNIPGLPQIPTDNLYKFAAIGALLMTLVGTAGEFLFWWRMEDAMHALDLADTRRHQVVGDYSDAVDRLKARTKGLAGC